LLFFIVLLCCCAFAYFWTPPEAFCKWGVEIDVQKYNAHYKERHWVFGAFYKEEIYNHNGDLVYAYLVRPDFSDKQDGKLTRYSYIFTWDGTKCTDGSASSEDPPESNGTNYVGVIDEMKEYRSLSFSHIDDAKWNGQKCMVYYNVNTSAEAYYVDYNGYLIGYVKDLHKYKSTIVKNYTYYSSIAVAMSDFTFDENYGFRCPDDRVFDLPSADFARCAATTTNSILSLVLAFIAFVVIIVF